MNPNTHPLAQAILDLVAELDRDGTMEALYFHGPDSDEPLAVAVRAWREAGHPMTAAK